MTKEDTILKALSYFDDGYACSQSIVLTFAEKFDLDLKTAKLVSSTFGGGMGRLREKCGAVTGGFMVLGLKFGNEDPKDMDTKLLSYRKVRELNKKVEERFQTTYCGELLKTHTTKEEVLERKHHKIICRSVISEVAGLVYDMLLE